MNREKGYNLLGLGFRSRRVQIGTANIENKIKKGSGRLLLIARDAGESNKRKLKGLCRANDIAVMEWGKKEKLSRIFPRTTSAVLILDPNLAKPFFEEREGLE